MKTIETKEDMIKWAQEINNGLGTMTIAKKCDYQDIWGHSMRNTLDKLFVEANGSRSLIICSVNNVMGYDEVEHLCKTWAIHKANEIINKEMESLTADHINRNKELQKKEEIFAEGKRAIYRRIKNLKKNIEILTRKNEELLQRIASYRDEARIANNHANEYERKAKKYDTIKEALQD